MYKKVLIGLFTILLFVGCSNKSGYSVFSENDTKYSKALDYTDVGDIVHSFETKAILNATYLNPLNEEKYNTEYENFLIGIYIDEDNTEEGYQDINNTSYYIQMNKKDFVTIRDFNSNDDLYNNVPLKNPYAKYYIVGFEKDGATKLQLKYEHINFGKVTLTFPAH